MVSSTVCSRMYRAILKGTVATWWLFVAANAHGNEQSLSVVVADTDSDMLEAIFKYARAPAGSFEVFETIPLLSASIDSRSWTVVEHALGLCIKLSYQDPGLVRSLASKEKLTELVVNCPDRCAAEAAKLSFGLYGTENNLSIVIVDRLNQGLRSSSDAHLIRLLAEYDQLTSMAVGTLTSIAENEINDAGIEAITLLIETGNSTAGLTDRAMEIISSDLMFLNPRIVGYLGRELKTTEAHYKKLLNLQSVFNEQVQLNPIQRRVSISNDEYYSEVLSAAIMRLEQTVK